MNRIRLISIWSVTFMLLNLVLSSCQLPPPPPLPARLSPVVCQQRLKKAEKFETEAYWVKDQIVISGAQQDIKLALQLLRDQDIQLELLEECIFGDPVANYNRAIIGQNRTESRVNGASLAERYKQFLADLRQQTGNELEYPPNGGPLVTSLYKIVSHQPIVKVVNAVINLRVPFDDYGKRLVKQHERPYYIFADPNYLVGPSVESNCGSPHGVGNSPHGVGNSPYAGPGIITDTLQASQFFSQTAFTTIGLSASKISNQGENVVVGILDTSPFTDVVTNSAMIATVPITWAIPQPFTLTVAHPNIVTALAPQTTAAPRASQHGLFVAGLVEAVAPASQVHLVRILNDAGCGDMASLNQELNNFVTRIGFGKKIVINLSMGVNRPTTPSAPTDTCNLPQTDETLLKCQIFALGNLIAYQYWIDGVVIVAAAGNDSAEVPRGATHNSSQTPADSPLVIGVAASTVDGKDATCYTNVGQVAAPGGDGLDVTDTTSSSPTTLPCAPVAKKECHDSTCAFGLMSLIRLQPGETGYAYWSGSSFATPLVSGMAARLLNNGNPTNRQVITQAKQPLPGGFACLPTGIPAGSTALGFGVVEIDGSCP